ncbi:MAG: gliding motility-associated C-terminal domain-containing protein [Lewinellaceae bacterium]|nr:gliding motility-associated C-terminal domain-containing protein [Saprospiraceae bacterium]MCB9344279.1 gliding motility-associated C-terminal domain-containing protein [Lewinellaceae bacterium]
MNKMITIRTSWLLLLLVGSLGFLRAQAPINDECINAIQIDNPSSYCSDINSSNISATPSVGVNSACLNFLVHDVWFSFVAPSTSLEIVLSSPIFSTLSGPAIGLYSGTCPNGLSEESCIAGLPGSTFEQLQVNNLTIGETYYIRVDALSQGLFQLCVHEIGIDAEITGDCPTGVIVCDKDKRQVQFVAGPGDDPTEWSDATCLQGFPGESNTSWFVFTAENDGTLEFTLTPDNPADDLDFVVYYLPNGPGDCSGKVLERCMAAGNIGAGLPCTGPTGLNATSTDISEPPGCLTTSDNFLRYMDIMAGETYALAVNNFTSTGAGFSIDWGGTVEFEGPEVTLYSDDPDSTICLGETIVYRDTIVPFDGFIESWNWDFGANATPIGDTLQGPHAVQYVNTGMKTVTLRVWTNDGCLVKKTLDIQVDTCCALMAEVEVSPSCPPDSSCYQAAALLENFILPVQYTWSTSDNDSIVDMLQGGTYTLIVEDALGCMDTVEFTVESKAIFEIPNAFTPNGDQFNDVFRPAVYQSEVEVLEFKVWNRWGSLIYDDPTSGWDGTVNGLPATSDVYVYLIKIRNPGGEEEYRSGDVTLLR